MSNTTTRIVQWTGSGANNKGPRITYNGYTIKRTTYQGLPAYTVTPPTGPGWAELALNISTAKKWVDADIAERQSKP